MRVNINEQTLFNDVFNSFRFFKITDVSNRETPTPFSLTPLPPLSPFLPPAYFLPSLLPENVWKPS